MTTIVRRARLSDRLSVTITARHNPPGLSAEWSRECPEDGLTKAELDAYRDLEDSVAKDLAARIGGEVLIYDARSQSGRLVEPSGHVSIVMD